MMNNYKEIPNFKEMIPDIIYVRKINNTTWEAKAKNKKGQTFGLATDFDNHISDIVLAVQHSIETGIINGV